METLVETAKQQREQMNIVVVGHVDHGKSTLVGRLLADTHSLPDGKLAAVKAHCARHSRPFEYAFLLDALKDEQSQGITIDAARCFFKTQQRDYIIIDAPGHIEFLKNMISGAARAEAALLLIDAQEGVQENSRRHGYMLSMLGIRQVVVCINKMDLIDYKQDVFKRIVQQYSEFLEQIHIQPQRFIPISAREGVGIVTQEDGSSLMPWYEDLNVLESFDDFQKEPASVDKALRLPVQDVYKFTQHGDDRRIIVGRIESGRLKLGDQLCLWPSGKKTQVKSIEEFNVEPDQESVCGQSIGFTMTEQVYLKPGELICKQGELAPQTASQIRVNLFWLGRNPLIADKQYKLKLGTAQVPMWLSRVHSVLDASELSHSHSKQQVDRYDVADCSLQLFRPIAFDLIQDFSSTARFVIVDDYEISGGGIVMQAEGSENERLQQHIQQREQVWERSAITSALRQQRLQQQARFVILTGPVGVGKQKIAKALEEKLFQQGRSAYYLGLSNSLLSIAQEESLELTHNEPQLRGDRASFLLRLGEFAHLFCDAGLILIATISDLDGYELQSLKTLNQPFQCLVVGVTDQDQALDNHYDTACDVVISQARDISKAVTDIVTHMQEQHLFNDFVI